MKRREFLAACGAAVCAAQERKPNIVLFMLDDLGYADVGCYGQDKIQTPHVDRLAREGVRFTDAYAGGPVCAPSRCVLMTGKHGGHARIRANAGTAPIGPEDVTVASWLQKQGYVCGGFGKWGLGDAGSSGVPSKHGFDEFFGYLHQVHAHTYWPAMLWDNEKRFEMAGNGGGKRGTYSAKLIAERSFAFLRKHHGRPFFLYATYTLPHGRFEPPSTAPYSDKDWPEEEKKYAAMVTEGDSYLGEILKMLGDYGIAENTLVIFASDNGGVGGEGHKLETFGTMRVGKGAVLRGQKGDLYEGGIRVPFVMRWPGKIRAGSVSREPVFFADVFATLRHAVDGRTVAHEDGESILALLRGSKAKRPLVWEDHGWDAKTKMLRPNYWAAVREGDFKGVRTAPGAALEVYNLRVDAGETKNIAAENSKVAARLEKLLKEQHTAPLPHAGDMRFVQ